VASQASVQSDSASAQAWVHSSQPASSQTVSHIWQPSPSTPSPGVALALEILEKMKLKHIRKTRIDTPLLL